MKKENAEKTVSNIRVIVLLERERNQAKRKEKKLRKKIIK